MDFKKLTSGPTFNPAQVYEDQADILATQIENLIEMDPVGAAKSQIGIFHLQKYDWMISSNDPLLLEMAEITSVFNHIMNGKDLGYPQFMIPDLVQHGKEITLQLLAMEHLEDEGELTPFAADMIAMTLEADAKRGFFQDPFSTFDRPDVTVVATHADGRVEAANLSGRPVSKEEVEAHMAQEFREVE